MQLQQQQKAFKRHFEIPVPRGRKMINVSAAKFQRLIAERVVEVEVARNGRQKTNIESLERALEVLCKH